MGDRWERSNQGRARQSHAGETQLANQLMNLHVVHNKHNCNLYPCHCNDWFSDAEHLTLQAVLELCVKTHNGVIIIIIIIIIIIRNLTGTQNNVLDLVLH